MDSKSSEPAKAGSRRLKPSLDPGCQKYIDDPDRIWYYRRWMTRDQVEKHRARLKRNRAKGIIYPSQDPSRPQPGRVFIGGAWRDPEQRRQMNAERNKRVKSTPGICGAKGCTSARAQSSSGRYLIMCRKHLREYSQNKYWRDPVYRIEKYIRKTARRNQARRRQLHGN